ncbi:hypothetical protein HYW54_00585 [Candidatus Gottesmanbacteria bacterium]|nr:hypothetical protein [Candidatus Gottesmanbacteria bacterium]
MRHIWSILCRSSQIDKETNNLSIINVFEQLGITLDQKDHEKKIATVNIPIDYEIVSLWVKDTHGKKEKAEIILEIVDPKGKILKSFMQTGEMPETMRRLRTRFRIQGLGITLPGIYIFVIKIKEDGKRDFRIASEVPLEVQLNIAYKNPTKN